MLGSEDCPRWLEAHGPTSSNDRCPLALVSVDPVEHGLVACRSFDGADV